MNEMTLSAQEIAEMQEVASWLERTLKQTDERQELTISEDEIKELENLSCTAARVMGRYFAMKERDFQKQVLKLPTFAARLRTLREHNNMTRGELAERCQISEKSIKRYENGETEPRANTLVAFAYWLHTKADVLCGRDIEALKEARENGGQWK